MTIGIYNINSQSYNMFSDKMLLPIIIVWYFLCVLVHKLSLFVGERLGIWKVKSSASAASPTGEDVADGKSEFNE